MTRGEGAPLDSRREFLAASLVAAGAVLLGGCGHEHSVSTPDSPVEPPVEPPDFGLNEAATAFVPAVRVQPPDPVSSIYRVSECFLPGGFVTSVETDQPFYAATLDDGPSPYNTDPILFAADKYGVKLTFFLIGDMLRAFPEIGMRIRDAGHEIGNHSVHHFPYTAIGLAPQIAQNQQIIQEILGVTPVVARAPGLTRGYSYLAACLAASVCEIQTAWTTNDSAAPRIHADQILREHMNGLVNGGFEINHDGGSKRPTPDAFDAMLAYSQSRGMTSVRSSELLTMGRTLPISGRYPILRVLRMFESQDFIPTCNFDVTAELTSILAAGALRRVQRSRVVEVLADREALLMQM